MTQRVHVAIWYILGPSSRYMGTSLGPKCIPYTHMDSLGEKGVQMRIVTNKERFAWYERRVDGHFQISLVSMVHADFHGEY